MKRLFLTIFIFLLIIISTCIILFKIIPSKNNNNKILSELYSSSAFRLSSLDYKDFDKMNNIYYKKISSYNEYQEYRNKYNLPDEQEETFNENFVIITSVENSNMLNLAPKELQKENNKLKIAFFKDNNIDSKYNSFKIIISKELESDIIEPYRQISEIIPYTETIPIEQIPFNYTLEQAQHDNCYIVDNEKNYNVEILNSFLENYKARKNSFIRMIKFYENKEIIRDIYYNAKDDIFLICEDDTRAFNNFSYNYYKYFKLEEKILSKDIKCYFLTSPYEEEFQLYTF